jgi:four helix bundle protein
MAAIRHFTDLIVYQKAFDLGRRVFVASQVWPPEERFALTDQIRRSARSVGANISESWGKRRYEAHFVSKLTDADTELLETEHWLLCGLDHGYLTQPQFDGLITLVREVGRMLGSMIHNPGPFLIKAGKPPKPTKSEP